MTTRIDFRTYLVLESTLIKRLRKAWRPLAAEYHASITDAIKRNDFPAAYEAARHIDLTPIGAKNREFFKYVLMACANFGAKVVTGNRDTVVGAGNHETLLNKVTDGMIYAIENNLAIEMGTSALRQIAEVDPNRPAIKLEPDQYVNDFVSFSKDGDKLLQLIASLHSSRLATWGFVAEAEILDVTQYRVTAVLDGRTSDFCRVINGHIFQVSDARRTVNQVLGLDNPDDIKSVQPWPKQNKAAIAEFKGMSTAEFVERNLHIPPYHPMCRTLLTIVGKPPRLKKPTAIPQSAPQSVPTAPPAPVMEPYVSTVDTFKEVGISIAPEGVAHWNDYVGLNPVEVYSKLSGLEKMKIIEGELSGNYRKLVIDKKGNLKFTLQQKLGDGEAKVGLVYDPYSGSLHQNYLTVAHAPAIITAAYLSTLYIGMIDVAQGMGAETLHIASSGASSAVMYAQAGFLPSPVAWFKMKESLLQRLDGGDLAYMKGMMNEDHYSAMLDMLNSKNESSFYALTAFSAMVGPYTVAEELFKDLDVDLSLNVSDPKAVAAAKEAFK